MSWGFWNWEECKELITRIECPEKGHLDTRASKMLTVAIILQMVNASRLEGEDNPVQLIYFVENQDGERLSAVESSDLINKIDVQRAAIILGYRIQGAVAQRKCVRLGPSVVVCAGLGSEASLFLTVNSECKAFLCMLSRFVS